MLSYIIIYNLILNMRITAVLFALVAVTSAAKALDCKVNSAETRTPLRSVLVCTNKCKEHTYWRDSKTCCDDCMFKDWNKRADTKERKEEWAKDQLLQ